MQGGRGVGGPTWLMARHLQRPRGQNTYVGQICKDSGMVEALTSKCCAVRDESLDFYHEGKRSPWKHLNLGG